MIGGRKLMMHSSAVGFDESHWLIVLQCEINKDFSIGDARMAAVGVYDEVLARRDVGGRQLALVKSTQVIRQEPAADINLEKLIITAGYLGVEIDISEGSFTRPHSSS